MRIKKNCDDCKAYELGRCTLGYKIKSKGVFMGIAVGGVPQEICPKPRTYNKLIELGESRRV